MNLFRIFSFLSCYLFSTYTMAAVDYISLHDIELNTPQALAIKLNIIESAEKPPLKFVLQQGSKKHTLSYQRLNQYMLRVQGNQRLTGTANLVVYTTNNDLWEIINTIKLNIPPTNKGHMTADTYSSAEQITSTKPMVETTKNQPLASRLPTSSPDNTRTNSRTNTSTNISQVAANQCVLTKQPQETLWRIATRYAPQWNIDVYSAMIAIYNANRNQFSQQHIKLLKANATLTCPTKNIMASLGSKSLMEEEFERLHNKKVIIEP
ncbi:FimV/HubP family polar landmark protein [Colwellia asteriadis]